MNIGQKPDKTDRTDRLTDRGIQYRKKIDVVKNLGWAGWGIVGTLLASAMTAAYQAGRGADEIHDLETFFKSELSKQAEKSEDMLGYLEAQFRERDTRYGVIIEQRTILLAAERIKVEGKLEAAKERISILEGNIISQIHALKDYFDAQLEARDVKLSFVYRRATEGERFTFNDSVELQKIVAGKCNREDCDRMQIAMRLMESRCLDTQKKIAALWERVMQGTDLHISD